MASGWRQLPYQAIHRHTPRRTLQERRPSAMHPCARSTNLASESSAAHVLRERVSLARHLLWMHQPSALFQQQQRTWSLSGVPFNTSQKLGFAVMSFQSISLPVHSNA